jgi:aryl-alcohol dehydrogenase-like predicted oxidoreductase
MQLRKLGRSDLMVSPLCLGGNVFGWTVDELQSFALLDEFVGAGFNFIDTADVYSAWAPGNAGGESETIIGRWMSARGNRDKVVIATKVGWEKGLGEGHIREAVEGSLKRLQTDYIDLYQSHKEDPNAGSEETLSAYDKLIRAGKVRHIGASNFSPARLSESLAASARHGLPRYVSLQPLYNLYDRLDFEGELESLCREHGLGVITYYSLAAGFLTGKYRSEQDLDKSVRGQRAAYKYLKDRGRRILAALDVVARNRGTTLAQVSLAWLMRRPSITAPIASATSVEQLRELLPAAQLRLDPSEVELLDRASAGQAAA